VNGLPAQPGPRKSRLNLSTRAARVGQIFLDLHQQRLLYLNGNGEQLRSEGVTSLTPAASIIRRRPDATHWIAKRFCVASKLEIASTVADLRASAQKSRGHGRNDLSFEGMQRLLSQVRWRKRTP